MGYKLRYIEEISYRNRKIVMSKITSNAIPRSASAFLELGLAATLVLVICFATRPSSAPVFELAVVELIENAILFTKQIVPFGFFWRAKFLWCFIISGLAYVLDSRV